MINNMLYIDIHKYVIHTYIYNKLYIYITTYMVYHFYLPPSSFVALQAQVDEALKRADEMIEDYRKERRQARFITG